MAPPCEGGWPQAAAAPAFVHLIRGHTIRHFTRRTAKKSLNFVFHQRQGPNRLGEEGVENGIQGATEKVQYAETEVQEPVDGLGVGSIKPHDQEDPGGQSKAYENRHH